MDININDIDTDELVALVEELFGVTIVQADDDDEHLFWLVEGDDQDNAVEFIQDLLSDDERQKVLEAYLKEKGLG